MRNYWKNMSRREKRLALITGVMLIVGIAFVGAYRARAYLVELDSRIAQLEQEIRNLTLQDNQKDSVESAYRTMAADHSSRWSKEEIHDRLRREIYRLALKVPPSADSGSSVANLTREDYMVRIPMLREGTLIEDGKGFREYQIRFRIPATRIGNLLRFVGRLQASPQVLRIDSLEFARAPASTVVSVSLEVTRTVMETDYEVLPVLDANEGILANASFEEWDRALKRFYPWKSTDIEVRPTTNFVTHGDWCLEAIASQQQGAIYQHQRLQAATSYKLTMDITSTVPAQLTVQRENGVAYTGHQEVIADGKTYHYEVSLSTEAASGALIDLLAPYITVEPGSGQLHLDNVRLTKMRG